MPEVGLEPTLPEGNRILSPPYSRTGTYTEGQGETKPRFYQVLALLEGQGGTPDCGQNCGQNLGLSSGP